MIKRNLAYFVLVLACVSLWQRTNQVNGMGLVVPMYQTPLPTETAGYIDKIVLDDLITATSKITVVTIVKTRSWLEGFDVEWLSVLDRLKSASVNTSSYTLGYLDTRMKTLPLNSAKEYIDELSYWPDEYRPNGIFFDNVPSRALPSNLLYYQKLYEYVKQALGQSAKVFTNHKRTFEYEYFCDLQEEDTEKDCECTGGSRSTDVAIGFDGSFKEWTKSEISQQPDKYRQQLGAFVTGVQDDDALESAYKLASNNKLGFVFITDGSSKQINYMSKSNFNSLVDYLASSKS